MEAKEFGQFIAEVRKSNNITQIELARKLNVTDKAVSRWERGLGFPDINTLEPLADALGVSIVELMQTKKNANAELISTEKVEEILMRQVELNSAIAEEGLRGAWGAQIGKILMEDYGGDLKQQAKAYAAAGSDARMSGCEMPVVILSGSGNQGITACMPVVTYARQIGATKEQLCRALIVSDLVTILQKSGIGRLSAYCGAISAGVGAGAGICYLLGGGYSAVSHTVVNAVAILSGTICDGAKPSCAAKIAAAVDAGIMGYMMYLHHREFRDGEGIVGGSVDDTIANVGRLAQQGMKQTDHTILRIMSEG